MCVGIWRTLAGRQHDPRHEPFYDRGRVILTGMESHSINATWWEVPGLRNKFILTRMECFDF